MKRFPKEFKYREYTIRKTSFNWRVVELNELVETYQDAKDLIDRTLIHETSKKINTIDDDLEELLS